LIYLFIGRLITRWWGSRGGARSCGYAGQGQMHSVTGWAQACQVVPGTLSYIITSIGHSNR